MANTLSVTTAPPISSAIPDADHGDDRQRCVLEGVHEQDAALPHALGAGGADIVLLQHLEHGGARDAGDQRDVDAAERDGGQNQVLAATARALDSGV